MMAEAFKLCRPNIHDRESRISFSSAITAGDEERFTGDPRRICRGKKSHGRSDVLGLADASQRSLRFNVLAEVALSDSSRMSPLSLDNPWVDGIHANVPWAQFR